MTEAISKATPLIEQTNGDHIGDDNGDIMNKGNDKDALREDDRQELDMMESVIASEEKKEDESRAMIDTVTSLDDMDVPSPVIDETISKELVDQDNATDLNDENETPEATLPIDEKYVIDAKTGDMMMPIEYDDLSDTAVASYPSKDEDSKQANNEDELSQQTGSNSEINESPTKNIDLTCAPIEATPSKDEQSIKTTNENKANKEILNEEVIETSSSKDDALINATAMEDSPPPKDSTVISRNEPSEPSISDIDIGVSQSMEDSTVYTDLESKSFESFLGRSDVKSPQSEKENQAIDMTTSKDSVKENVPSSNWKTKRTNPLKVASTPTSHGSMSQASPNFLMRTFGSAKSPRNMEVLCPSTTSTISAKEEQIQNQFSPGNAKTKTDLIVKISEERYRLTQEVQKLQEELEALNATNKELKDIYEKVNTKNEQDENLIQDLLNEKEAFREDLKVTKVSVAELSSDLIKRDATIRKQTKLADKEKIKFQSVLEKNQTLQMEKAALQEELRDMRKSFEKETKQVTTLTSQLNRTKKSLDETQNLKETLKESLRESMTERNDMKKELASLSRDKYKLERQVADLTKSMESTTPVSPHQKSSGIRWFSSSSLTTSNTNNLSTSLPLAKIDSKIFSRKSPSEDVPTEVTEKQKAVKKPANRALFNESPKRRRGFAGLFGGLYKEETVKTRSNKIPDVFNSSSHNSNSLHDVDTKNSNLSRMVSRTGLVRQRSDQKPSTDDNINQLKSTEKKPATRRSFKAFSSSSKSSKETKNLKLVSCMSAQNIEGLREELKEERMFVTSEKKPASNPKIDEISERPPRPTISSVVTPKEKDTNGIIWNKGNASLSPKPTHLNSVKKLNIVSSPPMESKPLEVQGNNSVSTALTLPEDSD